MTREEVYVRLLTRIEAIQTYAKTKGDGVLADKMRKTRLDVMRLEDSDKTPKEQEI